MMNSKAGWPAKIPATFVDKLTFLNEVIRGKGESPENFLRKQYDLQFFVFLHNTNKKRIFSRKYLPISGIILN